LNSEFSPNDFLIALALPFTRMSS